MSLCACNALTTPRDAFCHGLEMVPLIEIVAAVCLIWAVTVVVIQGIGIAAMCERRMTLLF